MLAIGFQLALERPRVVGFSGKTGSVRQTRSIAAPSCVLAEALADESYDNKMYASVWTEDWEALRPVTERGKLQGSEEGRLVGTALSRSPAILRFVPRRKGRAPACGRGLSRERTNRHDDEHLFPCRARINQRGHRHNGRPV